MPKLGYVFRIRALARLISASSKEKILHLNSLGSKLESNSVKFANLALNFTRRDPHLENSNLKFATLCVSKAMSPPLTCSGVGGGLGAEGATLYFASLVAASRP